MLTVILKELVCGIYKCIHLVDMHGLIELLWGKIILAITTIIYLILNITHIIATDGLRMLVIEKQLIGIEVIALQGVVTIIISRVLI